MSFRLLWPVVALLMLCALSGAGCGGGNDLGELADKLAASGAKGKTSTRFILNRGVGDANDEKATKLARELGFTEADGTTDPAVVTVPMKGQNDWLGAVTTLHKEGKTKAARAIDIGSPDEVIREAVKRARAKHANDHAGFLAFLRDQKVSSEPAGLKTLEGAKLPAEGDTKSPLHYFAQRFFLEKAYEELRQKSDAVHKLKPWLGVGGPYAGNFEETVDAQVLQAWRTKALTSPWVAERSWQNGDFSPQGLGYYLALARAALAQNDILCDLHVGTGNYADGVRRSFYLGVAQGARGIRFVGAVPPSSGNRGESLAASDVEMWKTLRDLGQEIAKVEPVVLAAKTRPGGVGLVVSLTQELWDNSPWVHEERKAIYHAARLGGHNIVILNDEDIQEGKLSNLASIYYVGRHIQRETAKVLKKWVMDGGSLACVGGPFLDEYGKPFPEMTEFLGVAEHEWQAGKKAGAAKITLAQEKRMDEVEWGPKPKREFPVVYWKLKWKPTEIKPGERPIRILNAKFKDGSPAVVTLEYSPISHVWLYAAPLGSGWLKTVLPARDWNVGSAPSSYNHRLFVRELDGDAGDMVMGASGDAKWDVITDNLKVETILMEGNRGIALVCINWSNEKPQAAHLTAQFLPKGLERATSLESGPLTAHRRGAVLDFKTKITVTDVVIIDEPPKADVPEK